MNRRAMAANLLRRVRTEGAWANVVVERAAVPEEARAELRASVFGTLRWIGQAEAAVAAALDRPPARLQAEVRHLLLIGAHELIHTDTPAPVVVSACVDAIKELGAPRAGGLVNAVLRSVAEVGAPELGIVAAAGFPPEIHESLVDAWGDTEAEAFVAASNLPPRVGLRIRPGSDMIGDPVPGIPEAALVDRTLGGHPIQDPASVAVVQALDPGPGQVVVDLGAAPGGKSLHVLDRVGRSGAVVAVERHHRRARTGASRVPGVHWVVADAVVPPLRPGTFSLVLLDAPCSGLGTLRRRPEIRERVTPAEVERLALLQRAMVESALLLLAPGGRLVYSVCTVTPEETVGVVAGLGFRPPDLPGRVWGDGVLLAPHLGPTDGMFVAVAST